MIGLLVLGILACLLWAAWFLMRQLASHGTRWQLRVAPVLIFPIVMEVVQHYSGYTLASVWGPSIILSSAFFSYLLLMFLLWDSNRIVSIFGLVLPVAYLASNFVGWLLVAAMVLSNVSTEPVKQERISSTIFYRVVRYAGVWGGATPPYTYEIYENPRMLPLFWKEVTHQTVPCGNGSDVRNLEISVEPNGEIVDVSCMGQEKGRISIRISLH
jgi:hypothetical protein